MSHVKEMSNVLIDSVLSSLGGSFRLFGFETEEKPKPPAQPEPEPYIPPEPITLEKLKIVNSEIGTIYTCFPESRNRPEFSSFPESYYTLSAKEKLLLLFAENFRRQFKELYHLRRPLVLAAENECQVQKFVSTTIRPTTFVEFPELIDNWQACASFVADHIIYEPLEEPTKIPTRLRSPDNVLKLRKGNSFEIATLLCSILVGFGFPALVVSGYATREVSTNDQRRVKCPYIPVETIKVKKVNEPDPKYRLKDTPFLKSKFLMMVGKKKSDTESEKVAEDEHQKQLELEEIERPPPDPQHGFRTHAWVVMIKNLPWCYKEEFKCQTNADDYDEENQEPMAFFIEPSTGFQHELTDSCYQGIESIWNHQNYFVNRQFPNLSIRNMRWNLSDTDCWEKFLPGEPYELRSEHQPDEDEDLPTADQILAIEKHLDMPISSWVDMLHINIVDYEERYVNGEKREEYKYSVYEKFAPYKNADGLMKRLTIYETLEYENLLKCYEWYENRSDLMKSITRDFKINEVIEEFHKGRADSLKTFIHFPKEMKKGFFKFYSKSRFDCLKDISYDSTHVTEFYENRRDLLKYRKFELREGDPGGIEKIIEHSDRNDKKSTDIAICQFNRDENTIFVQFHYDDDCITSTTKLFTKPPRNEEETSFNSKEIEGYVANPWTTQLNDLELYYMLQELLKREEKSVDSYHTRETEIREILQIRIQQIEVPLLKFSIFDPLRNESARKLRLHRFEQMKIREMLAKTQQADFLAPYLVRFEDKKPSRQEIDAAIEDCLSDIKNNYKEIANELQRRYDEAATEMSSLKRFLHRYMDQLSTQDYEKFIMEGENIERYRKIIQKRMAAVNEESNRKYANLVESIPARLEQFDEPKPPKPIEDINEEP